MIDLDPYMRKPSHVMSTVQLKPKMDMKPKFRYTVIRWRSNQESR